MKFDVYCDESRPDLLGSMSPPANFMVIGSLWLATDHRESYKAAIHKLRDKHRVGGEFKWQKISPSRQAFYNELIEWFFDLDSDLRFRCIAVEHENVNLLRFHNSDQELGFYKFYYQMLHHWILDYNDYALFCDFKSNRESNRLHVLKKCLEASNLSSQIPVVQSTRSKESVLMQLTDVLTGAVGARMNDTLRPESAKANIVSLIEAQTGKTIGHTIRGEQKFNVFKINLQGGW